MEVAPIKILRDEFIVGVLHAVAIVGTLQSRGEANHPPIRQAHDANFHSSHQSMHFVAVHALYRERH